MDDQLRFVERQDRCQFLGPEVTDVTKLFRARSRLRGSVEHPNILALCAKAVRLGSDNVLYRSLPGLASLQRVSGSLAGDGDHSLNWMAAAKCA